MQATENGNSFSEFSPPTCWALRNGNCLLAFLVYEETIRLERLTLTTQVPVDSSRGEEPLEAAACRVSPVLQASQEAPHSGERQVKQRQAGLPLSGTEQGSVLH